MKKHVIEIPAAFYEKAVSAFESYGVSPDYIPWFLATEAFLETHLNERYLSRVPFRNRDEAIAKAKKVLADGSSYIYLHYWEGDEYVEGLFVHPRFTGKVKRRGKKWVAPHKIKGGASLEFCLNHWKTPWAIAA